jgi:citrate lyase subunit beta/citryl-CoA lyase
MNRPVRLKRRPRLRSLLFVPGDRPDRIEKAYGLGADALILDLEDAVAPSNKDRARDGVVQALRRPDRPLPLLVRVNELAGEQNSLDLAAIAAIRPDGYMLPKAEGAEDVERLLRRLKGRGVADALVLPIAGETPGAFFSFESYAAAKACLAGLTWGAEDLATALGLVRGRRPDGSLSAPLELARSLTLVGGRAAGVPSIETVYPAIHDLDGLRVFARRARDDGFSGMLAIHPSQVAIINETFTPTPEEVDHARRVVELFEQDPEAGVLALDGKMVDAPHLKRAHQLLAYAGEGSEE